ncbi:MAG: hypothetical protein OXH51_16780 [Gemmatimonadetes bacterium]|nr:hypothetical protein [Gemmatimonadota bacterium]MCY3678629.1 hypothetical protein [Gemmatimonadota bacterium]MYA41586.1 hypothetical protein [Gemmatimonadota bacterium]MYE95095.1 hypothetical protein [Gemmatimonadota bacterium]MYJ09778.1 hypothetical protein [Gemmatimonadota bacterium]
MRRWNTHAIVVAGLVLVATVIVVNGRGPIGQPGAMDRAEESTASLRILMGEYTGPIAAAPEGTLAHMSRSPDLPYVVSSDAWRHAVRSTAYRSMPTAMWTAVGVETDARRLADGRSIHTVTFADSSAISTIWTKCGDDHCLDEVQPIRGRRVGAFSR